MILPSGSSGRQNRLFSVFLLICLLITYRNVFHFFKASASKERTWSTVPLTPSVVDVGYLSDNQRHVLWEKEEALTKDEIQRHGVHLEYLPLQDWEVASGGQMRTCAPPAGIPQYCCLGGSSSGGEVKFIPENCRNHPDDLMIPYMKTQNHSIMTLRQLRLPYPSARRCDLCHLMHTLARQNLRLAFLGDSLMRQIFTGLECNLRRRGYDVKTQIETAVPRTHNETRWRYKWGFTYQTTVTIPGAGPDGATTVRFFQMYRPSPRLIQEIHDTYGFDVLVFDHGLHYFKHEMWSFAEDMRTMLEFLGPLRIPLLIWRETTTQHFKNVGGHFDRGMERVCPPIPAHERRNTSYQTDTFAGMMVHRLRDWRLLDASDPAFASLSRPPAGRHELVLAPIRQYTMPLHDLHPSGRDCTHYCTTPFLWLPLWRMLRVAVDRMVRNGPPPPPPPPEEEEEEEKEAEERARAELQQ